MEPVTEQDMVELIFEMLLPEQPWENNLKIFAGRKIFKKVLGVMPLYSMVCNNKPTKPDSDILFTYTPEDDKYLATTPNIAALLCGIENGGF